MPGAKDRLTRTATARGPEKGHQQMGRLSALLIVTCVAGLPGLPLEAHSGHETAGVPGPTSARGAARTGATSGQGAMRFRVLYTSERLPEKAREVLASAHGGFAVDRRPGRGEVYFALPGAGLLRISADLRSIRLLETDPAMRETNLHNTTLWEAADGTPLLSLPAGAALNRTYKLTPLLGVDRGGTWP